MPEIEKAAAREELPERPAITDGVVDKEAGEIALREETKPTEATQDSPAPSTNDHDYPGGWKLAFAFMALILVLLISGLADNMVATAVPHITDQFHSVADVGWYYTAYHLSSCALQFSFGKLYKMYSTKYLFIMSNFFFMCGSIICAAAVTSPMFIVGRAVMGIGFAGGTAGFFSIIVQTIPLRRRALLGGVFGAVESLSAVAGPPLGGVLTQYLSWHWCFWINVPTCGAAQIALFFLLPNVTKTGEDVTRISWKEQIEALDLTGTLLIIPAMATLFTALNWAGITYPWSNYRIITLLVVSGVLIICFIVDQIIRGDKAVVPPRIAKTRNVYAGSIFIATAISSLGILEYYAPTYFQAVLGYSPARAGYMMTPCLVGTLVGVFLQGVGTTYFGYYTPFMIACSALLSVGAGLLSTWDASTGLAKIIIYLAIVGFGAGIGLSVPQLSVQTALAKGEMSMGIAVVLFARAFGPALFVSIAQAIFTNSLPRNLHQLAPQTNFTGIGDMGVNEIKNKFGGKNREVVILGFSESITQVWYLALGLACFSVVGALLTEWHSVKEEDH